MSELPQIEFSFRVFLSSTDDPVVREYREAATKVILESEFCDSYKPIEMGGFDPSSQTSLKECEVLVTSCSVYIGIIGPIYGTLNTDVDKSYTEFEYSVAKRLNRERGIFFLPEDCIKNEPFELILKQGELFPRQKKFKEVLNAENTTRSVTDIADFKIRLAKYLRKIKSSLSQPSFSPLPEKISFLGDHPFNVYDGRPVQAHSIDELDQSLITSFLAAKQSQSQLRERDLLRVSSREQLTGLGIATGDHPTLGAFLCFAPMHLLEGKLSACGLYLVAYDGPKKTNGTIQEKYGNLIKLYDDGMNFFRSRLRQVGIPGDPNRDDLEIPEIILREALVNALIHREYQNSEAINQPTRIEIYSDRVEIVSFGGLLNGIDINLLNEDPSRITPRRRNPIIAKIFFHLTFAELGATGIARMRELCVDKELYLPKIVLESSVDNAIPSLKVILFRPVSSEENTFDNLPSVPDIPVSPIYPLSATRKRTNRADVMISSTSNDLSRHRKTVIDAIWRVGMFPLSMEHDEAVADSDAIDFSLNMVDEAKVYVGIFGFRYGYIPKDVVRNPNKISVTEMEYRRAIERDIPILIFIMDDNHPLKAKDKDTTANLKKLDKLKSEMKTKHIVSFFKSVTELREKVLKSLYDLKVHKLVDTTPDPEDESESDFADQPSVPTALTIPKPPNLYSVPPYILTNKFIGRVSELDELDSWAQSADPLLVIEAIGGMGKSALTWEWVNNIDRAHKAMPNLKGIFWWSFYERGATMEAFFRHALAYITRRNPDELELKQMRYEERANALLAHLTREPYLLVLDGLERVLLAYHRWDAAQMRDDSLDNDAADKSDPALSFRACTDPRDADFLQRLSIARPGKFLISSRLMPRALEDERDPLSGVRQVKLYGLNLDDAYRLMQERGVKKADRPTLDAFMTSIGCHSLLLKMVAGRIQNYRPAPGNFDKWYAAEGKEIHLTEMDIKQKRTHILQYAFEGLDATKRKLLSQVAAFNDAVDYDTLSVFNPYLPPKPEKVKQPRRPFPQLPPLPPLPPRPLDKNASNPFSTSGLSPFQNADSPEEIEKQRLQREQEQKAREAKYQEDQANYNAYLQAMEAYPKSAEYRAGIATFDMALIELEERGLLQWDREKDSYDLHPVVRGYSFDLLEQDDKVQVFDRIHDYFQSRPEEDVTKALEVEDLKDSIEIYRAILGAGKYNEAADYFRNLLYNVLVNNIAAYPKALELLTPLFSNGLEELPSISDTTLQSQIIGYTANILSYMGRATDAQILENLLVKLSLDRRNASSLAISLLNYSISSRKQNHLAQTLRELNLALELGQINADNSEIARSQLLLFTAYYDIGDWQAAEAVYVAYRTHLPSTYWQAQAETSYARMLFQRGLDTAQALDQAEELARQSRSAIDIRRIHNLRGDIALVAGQLDEAADYFQTAITLDRKSGLSGSSYRGGLARVRATQGRFDEAHRLIDEGVTDIDAAETFLTLGDTERAKDHALKAYKDAWADGPPYSWWWELERSKKVLDALGEPYPDMPPFDSSKVEPIPYEDEILAFIEELKAQKATKEAEVAAKKAEGEDVDDT